MKVLDGKLQKRTREDAIALGLTTYFTGKPCKHGHIAERQVSSYGCEVCAGVTFRAWRSRNIDAEKARNDKYKNTNREIINAQKRDVRAANKEKMRAERKRHYEKNPDKHRQRAAKYRENNPAAVKEMAAKWKRNNRAYATALQRERDARRLKATPQWADKQAIREIYAECARVSALTGQPHEVDHFYPLRGKDVCGLHVEYNLRIIHAKVNRKKSNRIEVAL